MSDILILFYIQSDFFIWLENVLLFIRKQEEKEVMTSEQLSAIETETKTKKEELMTLKLERKRNQSGKITELYT